MRGKIDGDYYGSPEDIKACLTCPYKRCMPLRCDRLSKPQAGMYGNAKRKQQQTKKETEK